MNQMAKDKVRELLSETGHVLSVDDLEDTNRINEAAEKVTGSNTTELWELLDRPVVVANITLHPLTIGAHLWMIDWCDKAEAERPHMWSVVVAYAMANSHRRDRLTQISNSEHPWIRLFMWSMTVRATSNQLERAFRAILPGYDYDPEEGDDRPLLNGKPIESLYGSIVAFLTKEYGATPQYWMWEESIKTMTGYINDSYERNAEQSKNAEKSMHKNGHAKPQVSEDTFIALKELRACVAAVRTKWLTIK